MSSSITAYSLSMGLLPEPIPPISGRVQGTPWTSRQLTAGPSLMSMMGGVQYHAQGHFDMQLSPAIARI